MQAIYRIRQGLDNLTAGERPEDELLAARYLSPSEIRLFDTMQPADRRHAAGVIRSMLAIGVDDRHILKAALLHDVGKAGCRIGVLHRTITVVLTALLGGLPSFLTWPSRGGVLRPFYVLENHPRLGASALARAGCDERVWRLAELHHTDPDVLGPIPDGEWIHYALRVLRKADGRN